MLEVRELDVRYGDARALDGVSIDVADGEIVSIVGPNGAGKSTLVNTLAGLHRAVGGGILMDGREVTRIAAHQVCRQGIAVVPEGRRIFPDLTVRDNLELGAYRPEARAQRDATIRWVHELFPRLRDRGTQRAGSLSGGEQQMLAIGRALMAQPRLLLLDEPSLGLAPIVVDGLFEVIRVINASGVGILLVEQNVRRALEVSTRGYLLAEGRIVLAGTSDELLASDAVRRSVLGI
ncbi:MAG: ABC transporter ATP-binding protein [Candidatus Limnocylindrales bacterium]